MLKKYAINGKITMSHWICNVSGISTITRLSLKELGLEEPKTLKNSRDYQKIKDSGTSPFADLQEQKVGPTDTTNCH